MPNDSSEPSEAQATPLSIKIQNPKSGQRFIRRTKAKRAIARGLAQWVVVGRIIRFCENLADHRVKSIAKSVDLNEMRKRSGYDAVGTMTLDQIQRLPVAGDAQKMVRKGPKNFTPRRLNRGPVRCVFGVTA